MIILDSGDVSIFDAGSIVLFGGVTDKARVWLAKHLPADCPRMGERWAVGRRYADDIIDGADDDGLTFCFEGGGR